MKLNLGCGSAKITGCVNVDKEASCEPDLLLDFRVNPLPFDNSSIESVYLFHTIEHIEKRYWMHIFVETHRVLEPNGLFVMSYPEFSICAKNYMENKDGERIFWEATIYGLQRYPSDYHVSIADTDQIRNELLEYGFGNFEAYQEPKEAHNTVLKAYRVQDIITYEQVLNREIYGNPR